MVGQHTPEIVGRLHTELDAQPLERLRSEPLDAKERDHARRVPLPEPVELLHPALVEKLADLRGRALAHPVDLLELLGRQLGKVHRLRGNALRGALVGADTKRLRVAFLEHRQLGELPEHLEDVLFGVNHAGQETMYPA